MEGYKPGTECSQCKGRCCRERGCSLSPQDMWQALKQRSDFGGWVEDVPGVIPVKSKEGRQLREMLLQLLNQPDGLYALDFFSEKDGPCFYLRMRHKCYTFIGVDAIGECVALTESGCALTEEQRPKGGRFLESRPDGHCIQHYTREQMCEDWTPYVEVLKDIWEEYHTKFEEDGTFERCDNEYFAWIRRERL